MAGFSPMSEDDHYISNARNAHIDTSDFERELRERFSGHKCGVEEIFEFIYKLVSSKTNIAPKEPDDSQLICRYLSPVKFLRFLHTRSIDFPMANQFSDHWECRIPDDYEKAALHVLHGLGISINDWDNLVRRKAGGWNVSCWTQLDGFDDHLLWDSYAGGAQGVGITIRYGVLKDCLAKSVRQLDVDGVLYCGSVNYESLSLLPFNKHYIFRNEREIRFAFRARETKPHSVSINDIFGSFGIRISPAANAEYRDTMRLLWLRYGGEDRVQWPQ